MSFEFRDGFEFFQKNAGAIVAAFEGGAFGAGRAEYVANVQSEIDALEESINQFLGDNTPAKQLKGDIAEFWHSGTFNIDAARNNSLNRVTVERSNEFASVDASSNFGKEFGLKYYATAQDSAKQQAKSIFERFKEYQSKGGKDDLDKFLADRNYTSDAVLNDPMYQGQIRVIPKDQLEEAVEWLKRKIATEKIIRPEQIKRYQDTLDLLSDRISDNQGNESIPLSREDAEKLAVLAKEGKFEAEDFDITAPELLELEMLVKESLKAGLSAAVISIVLKVGPEVFKAISYLIKNGEIDEGQFKKIGFAAVSGGSEGFIRGTVAAAITTCCKSGLFGEALKKVDPGVVGAVVAVTMNTLKNAYQVAIGKKTRTELSQELIKDMFVTAASMAAGYVGQAILHDLPVVGYLIGSFVGSVVGSFVYNTGYKAAISFCVETGVTMFGLVDQDYKLPDDIIEEIGLETFDFDSFEAETFEVESFEPASFEFDKIEPDTLGIKMLRRGVISVSKVGYIE